MGTQPPKRLDQRNPGGHWAKANPSARIMAEKTRMTANTTVFAVNRMGASCVMFQELLLAYLNFKMQGEYAL
jgi:hypothetical protein